MDYRTEAPLKVGDIVRYVEGGGSATGVVLEQLPDHYVRVRWSDLPAPTTHRVGSVRRADSRGPGAR